MSTPPTPSPALVRAALHDARRGTPEGDALNHYPDTATYYHVSQAERDILRDHIAATAKAMREEASKLDNLARLPENKHTDEEDNCLREADMLESWADRLEGKGP
jgi:hypothetical protein